MKVYTIGRGEDCSIILDDPAISRCHALLKVYASGRMEIVSVGANNTFVNGVKVSANAPFPITRRDVVSFARVKKLDWDLIENPFITYLKWGIGSMLVIVSISIVLLLLFSGSTSDSSTKLDVVTTEDSESGQQSSNADSEVGPNETNPAVVSRPEGGLTEGRVPDKKAKQVTISPSDKEARDSAMAAIDKFFPKPSTSDVVASEVKKSEKKTEKQSEAKSKEETEKNSSSRSVGKKNSNNLKKESESKPSTEPKAVTQPDAASNKNVRKQETKNKRPY